MTYTKIPRRLGLLPAFLFAAVLQTSPASAFPRVIHNFALDGTMNNGDYVGPAICAVACFAATYSFSTIPYYSLDQPRNVTLAYNGDQASPRPFLFADVDPNDGTGVMVNGYTMEATVNSSPVTFVNGSTQLSFGGGPYTQRLSGQFDASALATNVYPVVITIRATFADGQVVTKTINTQVMVVNEMSSPIAKGWTVAGVQHLYSTLGNGFMVTEGDGSAVRFTSLNIKGADYTSLSFDNGTQSYTRWYPDGTRVVFNSVGQETSLIEINGRTYTFWYDSSGRLQAVKDPYRKQPSGAVTSIGLSYDANGLQMIQEPGADGTQWQGRGTWFVVNANRCLQSAQDPDGVSTVFTCDANGRLATIADRRGGITTLGYDNSWKLSSVTLPQVPIDAGGGTTTLANPVVHYYAWQIGGVGSVTDPVGRTTQFGVNRFGQAVNITDPAGRHRLLNMNGILPLSITRPDGSVDSMAYDGSGRVTMTKAAGGSAIYYQHAGPLGQVDSVYGAGTRLEGRRYDASNRLIHVDYWGARHEYVDLVYDPATSRIDTVKDDMAHRTTYAYDARFGNLRYTGVAGGRGTTKTFDALGRDSTVSGTGSSTSTTTYDVLNRPTNIYDGVNATPVVLGYDALFMTDLHDQKGNGYHVDHNSLGWNTAECDPFAACVRHRYDAAGDLTSTTNRRNMILSSALDNLGRVVKKFGSPFDTCFYSYLPNDLGYVAWNSVERDSVFVSPGAGGGVASDSTVIWRGTSRYRIFHGGLMTTSGADSTVISSNTGLVFNKRRFVWGTDGKLVSVNIDSDTTKFSYNPEGLLSEIDYHGVPPITLSNTALHAPRESYYWSAPLEASLGRAQHYDLAARIDQMTPAQGAGNQSAFGYDLLGRLMGRDIRTSCTKSSDDYVPQDGSGIGYYCPSLISSDAFTYDATGNRTDHGGSPTTANRYASFNGSSYTYDADGNVSRKTSAQADRQYFWTLENKLATVTYNNGTSQTNYHINALGKPIRIITTDATGRHVRELLWDGDQLLAELDSTGKRIADYIYLPGTIDQPFAQVSGALMPNVVRYHHQDALGNVMGTVEGGVVSQTASYDSWGVPTVQGNTDNKLLWKGLLWVDGNTSLYYMRNRWYDPEAGRFMNEDPAGFDGGINRYAFGVNDPVNEADPYGLSADIECYWVPGEIIATYGEGWVRYDAVGGHQQCVSTGGGGGGGNSTGPSTYDPGHGGGGSGGGGNQPSRRVKPDATSVAPLAKRKAAAERLQCELRSGLATSAAAGAAGTALGGVVGGVQYGPAWAQIGGVSGGIIATVFAGPESAAAGFYAGRVVGFTAGTLYGARKGRTIAGMAGAAVGIVAGIATCP